MKITSADEAALAATAGFVSRADFLAERARESEEKARRATLGKGYPAQAAAARIAALTGEGVLSKRPAEQEHALRMATLHAGAFEKWVAGLAASKAAAKP